MSLSSGTLLLSSLSSLRRRRVPTGTNGPRGPSLVSRTLSLRGSRRSSLVVTTVGLKSEQRFRRCYLGTIKFRKHHETIPTGSFVYVIEEWKNENFKSVSFWLQNHMWRYLKLCTSLKTSVVVVVLRHVQVGRGGLWGTVEGVDGWEPFGTGWWLDKK